MICQVKPGKENTEKLKRAQKCSILGPQNLGSAGGSLLDPHRLFYVILKSPTFKTFKVMIPNVHCSGSAVKIFKVPFPILYSPSITLTHPVPIENAMMFMFIELFTNCSGYQTQNFTAILKQFLHVKQP